VQNGGQLVCVWQRMTARRFVWEEQYEIHCSWGVLHRVVQAMEVVIGGRLSSRDHREGGIA
jgi:hypothetical protein